MISEDCYTRILGSVKLNIVIVLFIVVLVLPEVAYFRHHQNVSDFNKFGKKLEGGPTN
jgi:hypothetical protein